MTQENKRYALIGMLLAGFGTALFALKSIIIKLAYAKGIDPVTLLTLRMLVAFPIYALVFFYVIRMRPQRMATLNRGNLLGILFTAFLGYYLASLLDLMGLELITAQLERLILFTYPTMVAVLGWLFFREKLTMHILMALGLTYAGVVVLYFQEAALSEGDTLRGVLLVAGSALSFSLYVLIAKRYILMLGSLLFTSLAMMFSTLYVIVHFVLVHPLDNLFVTVEVMWLVLALSIISTVIPSFMISEAISRIGGARTSIIGVTGPVFTIALAVLVLGEVFTWTHFWGMLLVMGGVILLTQEKQKV